MNDTKIKIIEKLWDLVDNTLSFGCATYKWYRYAGEEDNSLWDLQRVTQYWYKDGKIFKWYLSDASLWQYHLWTILRWLEKKYKIIIEVEGKYCNVYEMTYYWYSWTNVEKKHIIRLDLSKPPMERSEKEDKKLLSFMESVE